MKSLIIKAFTALILLSNFALADPTLLRTLAKEREWNEVWALLQANPELDRTWRPDGETESAFDFIMDSLDEIREWHPELYNFIIGPDADDHHEVDIDLQATLTLLSLGDVVVLQSGKREREESVDLLVARPFTVKKVQLIPAEDMGPPLPQDPWALTSELWRAAAENQVNVMVKILKHVAQDPELASQVIGPLMPLLQIAAPHRQAIEALLGLAAQHQTLAMHIFGQSGDRLVLRTALEDGALDVVEVLIQTAIAHPHLAGEILDLDGVMMILIYAMESDRRMAIFQNLVTFAQREFERGNHAIIDIMLTPDDEDQNALDWAIWHQEDDVLRLLLESPVGTHFIVDQRQRLAGRPEEFYEGFAPLYQTILEYAPELAEAYATIPPLARLGRIETAIARRDLEKLKELFLSAEVIAFDPEYLEDMLRHLQYRDYNALNAEIFAFAEFFRKLAELKIPRVQAILEEVQPVWERMLATWSERLQDGFLQENPNPTIWLLKRSLGK